jgi:hypothetical protein
MINYRTQEKITVAVADVFAKRDLIGVRMRCLFRQNLTQMDRLNAFCPESHGMPRLDDKRMLNGMIFINCNGLRWRDVRAVHGPSKKLYTRWKPWRSWSKFAGMI